MSYRQTFLTKIMDNRNSIGSGVATGVRAAPGGSCYRGGKGAKNAENLKKKSRENSDCKFHMC